MVSSRSIILNFLISCLSIDITFISCNTISFVFLLLEPMCLCSCYLVYLFIYLIHTCSNCLFFLESIPYSLISLPSRVLVLILVCLFPVCSPDPCVYGKCSIYQNTYRCNCLIGATGRHCDQGISLALFSHISRYYNLYCTGSLKYEPRLIMIIFI